MLTIGELAAYAGVSIRTVRHYHQIGLLTEPPRDEWGHRRYGAAALIELRRICTLAEAGVPLRRIHEVLSATPADRDALLDRIDADLRQEQRRLREVRRRLDDLRRDPEGMTPDLVELIAILRRLGVEEDDLQHEREAWQLSLVLYPELTVRWLAQQAALFDDEQYLALYRDVLKLAALEPDEPTIEELAERNVAWTRAHWEQYEEWVGGWQGDPVAARLIQEHTSRRFHSPGHERLRLLIEQKMA